ncbi:MAG: hypothetical protein JNK87_18015 [Bryobacterales bacterium]|nr:hypothetical protein [Bryobacterales bacterium]
MNVVVMATVLLLAANNNVLPMALPAGTVLVSFLLETRRQIQKRIPTDLTLPSGGVVSEDGLRGFGLPPGALLRWHEVTHAHLRYVYAGKASVPCWVRLKSANHTVWVEIAEFKGGLDEVRRRVGDRLGPLQPHEQADVDPPDVPPPAVVIGAFFLCCAAILLAYAIALAVPGHAIAGKGVATTFGVILMASVIAGNSLTRLMSFSYVLVLATGNLVAFSVSTESARYLYDLAAPIVLFLVVAAACLIEIRWPVGQNGQAGRNSR